MKQKIQEEINKEYALFEKKVKPLREKVREIELKELQKILSLHKGIIYKKSYGKNEIVLKILNSITSKRRLKYVVINIRTEEDYSIHRIKERKKLTQKEVKDLIERILRENAR